MLTLIKSLWPIKAIIRRNNHTPTDKLGLFLAWFAHNGVTPRGIVDYCPALLAHALKFKYIHWPYSLRQYVKGKRVVDLGCGKSLHGIGFLLAGAKTYTGLDPIVEMDRDAFKDTRMAGVDSTARNMKSIGWTPAKIARRLPRINYRTACIQDLGPEERWDVLVMHNVTEHLMQIEDVIREIPAHLHPGGRVIFSHPNFYSWSGHHMAPRYVSRIEETDAEQRRYMDWAHLEYDPQWPDSILRKQNRIRLHELRALMEKYFEIESWRPVASGENDGALRWKDEILRRHPEFTKEELLTQRVICVARKRA